MQLEWQTVAALAIVALTVTIFLVRLAKPKSKNGCGHDCGCGKTDGPPHADSARHTHHHPEE